MALLVLLFALPFMMAQAVAAAAAIAAERLPDGGVAEAAGGGAVRAWYERPTGRYGHGVLGDAIEAGSLVAIDADGRRHEIVLPETQVFEDITPRLADLDGDGRNEIVAIRTDLARGAAVAVYELDATGLRERAATPPIGLANRWLSIAAIADFAGTGTPQIAVVRTPHIGGVLEVLALRGTRLVGLYGPRAGYSTHAIGSRDLTLAAAADLDGDGAAELLLPAADRRAVAVLGFGAEVRTLRRYDLPARVAAPIAVAAGRIAVPLEDGSTAALEWP